MSHIPRGAEKGAGLANGTFLERVPFDTHVITNSRKEGKKGNALEGKGTAGG
jgi:hypothetical protein